MSARAQGSSYRFWQEVPHNGPDIWFTDLGYGLMIQLSPGNDQIPMANDQLRMGSPGSLRTARRLRPPPLVIGNWSLVIWSKEFTGSFVNNVG